MIKIIKYRHFQIFYSMTKKKYKQAAIKFLFKIENSSDAQKKNIFYLKCFPHKYFSQSKFNNFVSQVIN